MKGQCMCGAVTFTATVTGNFGVCHCEMCRRWTGSALFGVSVPEAAMQIIKGDTIKTIRSSEWASRAFCGECGSGLWYRFDKGVDDGGGFEVPIGLFDDPNGFTLTREIFVDQKPDSFALTGDHQRLTKAETMAMFAPKDEGDSQ